MSKLMAFLLSIVYFFGSFGIGAKNAPTEITVTDADGNPISNVTVYYNQSTTFNHTDVLIWASAGTTDENGKILWEDKQYGDTTLYVVEGEFEFEESNNYPSLKVNVSRFKNEPITIVCAERSVAADAVA